MKPMILEMARHTHAPLHPWFDERLDSLIEQGWFVGENDLLAYKDRIIADLVAYREDNGLETVVIGMSGGVDSALTASLFKQAGWRVVGMTLPIDQDPAETARGIAACEALGIEHEHCDLSALYKSVSQGLQAPRLLEETLPARIRRGNIRARLRMITLYDRAHAYGGLVASTDNFSELSAGFWTLHGDVGDVSPIQALLKSWEVPMLARLVGVPEETWRAKPTDGLGIDDGDEAQLGATYLEWDITVLSMMLGEPRPEEAVPAAIWDTVKKRVKASWFKRAGPIMMEPAPQDRFGLLAALDKKD